MNSNELSKFSPKALKEYINAYNLPSKNAIEKSDLVRIIFNTRPISNDSEIYYRRHRTKQPPPLTSSTSSSVHSGDENTPSPFSFTNIMHEIFTPPGVPSSPRSQQRQARQQQEQAGQQQEQARQQQEQVRQQQEQVRQQQEQVRQEQARLEQQRRHQQQQARQQQETIRQQQQQQQRVREQQQRQTSPTQRTTTTSNTSPQRPLSPLSNDNLLSLHDLVKTKIDPSSLSVRTLKSILKANYVEQSHVIEKSELVKLVVRLADQHKAELESNKRNEGGGGNDDLLCRVCFDNQQNCVFLDCGHMVTCMDCAKKLIESRNECPICREPILKLVHVFRS